MKFDISQEKIKVLGLTFHKMSDFDRMGYAGAGPEAYICENQEENKVYILEPLGADWIGNTPREKANPQLVEIQYDKDGQDIGQMNWELTSWMWDPQVGSEEEIYQQ